MEKIKKWYIKKDTKKKVLWIGKVVIRPVKKYKLKPNQKLV